MRKKHTTERNIELEHYINELFQRKLNEAHIENSPERAVMLQIKDVVHMYDGKLKRYKWWKPHSGCNSEIIVYKKRSDYYK